MSKTAKIVGIIVIIVVAYFWFFDKNQQKAATNEPIKIGVITPLTGDGAIYGEALKKGLDLALEKINKNGGVLGKNVELIYEDSILDSARAVTIANKFIDIDKFPVLIVAEGSGATLAVAPLADKTKTIMMIPIASSAELREAGDYVFRVIPSDAYRGKEMARLAEQMGFKKIGILYVNDAYGVGIKNLISETVKEGNAKIVSAESFDSGATDFRSQLTKIKFSNPDVIMIEARKEYSNILRQIKELNIKSRLVASEVVENSILKDAGDSSERLLAVDFASPIDYVDFKSEYRNKFGTDAALYSDFGYDALGVLITAIKNADSTNNDRVKDSLYKINYQGATGGIKFDSYGEVMEKPFIIKEAKNGEFVPYEE